MNRISLQILFLLSAYLISCKSAKPVSDLSYEDPLAKHEFYKGKAKIVIETEKGSQKANLHLRLKKDEIIWISIINKVEAARILVTQDSIKFMDRLNKSYYSNSIDSMGSFFNFDLDFDLIQNILTSRAPESNVDWKKAGDETIGIEKRDNWLMEYSVDTEKKMLQSLSIREIQGANKITVLYNGILGFDGGALAEGFSSDAVYSKGNRNGRIKADLSYDKFNFASEDEMSFTFRIPSKYEKL